MYAYTAGCLLYLDIGTAQKSKRLFHLKPVKIIYKGVAGSLLKQDAELALSQGTPPGPLPPGLYFHPHGPPDTGGIW